MTLILDQIPDAKVSVIQVGTTVRKPLPVLKAYLDALDWQELPPHTRVEYAFIADWESPDDPAEAYLRQWADLRGGTVLEGARGGRGDYQDAGGPTHHWQGSAMERVGHNKNRLLQRAVERGADGVWLCDADLICDRTTLKSLWYTDSPIACAVYWTLWQTHVQGLQAAPQVWLQHPYELAGRGWEQGEFRRALLERQRIQVWGQGACTLIRTNPVLTKGVDFAYVPGVSREGMMAGEDRHFCLKAESLHIEMTADAWPDIYHIYHDRDVERIPVMVNRLREAHPESPSLSDDLVSLVLEAVEPLPQNGQYFMLPPTHLRGRLNSLGLLPELEEAVRQMKRGESQILPVHFPQHYALKELRGQRRLVKVTLVDCKPFGFAPIVEDEILAGSPGVWLDPTQYTPQQVKALVA